MIVGSVVTVSNTATLITKTDTGGKVVTVRHRGVNPIFLGGSAVTTSGFQLNAGESLSIDLAAGDALYGIVSSGTEPLHLLTAGWG